jgi:hypothetical protein
LPVLGYGPPIESGIGVIVLPSAPTLTGPSGGSTAVATIPQAIKFPYLHAGIANVMNGVSDCKICTVGDSASNGATNGAATGLNGSGWTSFVASLLSASGIPAAVGAAIPTNPASPTADNRFVIGSGWTLGNNAILPVVGFGGLGCCYVTTPAAVGTLVFTPTNGALYDSYDIYYLSNTGSVIGAAATCTVAGGTGVALNGNQGIGIFKATCTGTAAVNAPLTISTATGGSLFGCVILMVEPFHSTIRRVRLGCASINGASTVNWTNPGSTLAYGPLAAIRAFAANAWIMELGIDDIAQNPLTAMATIFANYSVLQGAMLNTPSDIIGLTATPLTAAVAFATQTAVGGNLKSWCQVNNAGFIDTLDAWGGGSGFNSPLQTLGYFASGDVIGHPSARGLADIGRMVADSLLAA